VQRRQYAKACKVAQWRQACRQLLKDCDGAAQRVRAARQRVNFGPRDAEQCAAFLRKERRAALSQRRPQLQMHLAGTPARTGVPQDAARDDVAAEHEAQRAARTAAGQAEAEGEAETAPEAARRAGEREAPGPAGGGSSPAADVDDDAAADAPDEVGTLVWSSDDDA
jgi:nucleolar complex protein 2